MQRVPQCGELSMHHAVYPIHPQVISAHSLDVTVHSMQALHTSSRTLLYMHMDTSSYTVDTSTHHGHLNTWAPPCTYLVHTVDSCTYYGLLYISCTYVHTPAYTMGTYSHCKEPTLVPDHRELLVLCHCLREELVFSHDLFCLSYSARHHQASPVADLIDVTIV